METLKRGNDSDSDIEEIERLSKKTKIEGNSRGQTVGFLGVKNVIKKQAILFAKKMPNENEKKIKYEAEHTRTRTFKTNNNTDKKENAEDSLLLLSERLRPKKISDIIGQDDILGENSLIPTLLKGMTIPSIIFWGPPGCGKTTLSRILIDHAKGSGNCRTAQLSAASCNISDIKGVIKLARNDWAFSKRKTLLFVDEIHRLNKLQQDAFLASDFESGVIILVGATTQNPSFYLNNALLSRCKVITLNTLSIDNMISLLKKACSKLNLRLENECMEENNEQSKIQITDKALKLVAIYSDGDARTALNNLECLSKCIMEKHKDLIDDQFVKDYLSVKKVTYDRNGEEHYNCISAFQKSIRGSDDNATIYWLTRMLEGGEDPLFIARRMVVIASEDVGLADANALPLAVSALQACQAIGLPECSINLAHCATYLARARKSVESYMAYKQAQLLITERDDLLPAVPLHLRNASTQLMKDLGYGKGYTYFSGEDPQGSKQTYLPPELQDVNFFKKN
ncbi:DgyrCDS6177 [Dimorphilus gyrociliatus]|uniref:DgyrCDS6177 n=1 Tax=Dimorphilus gyrociliatus TaxID=2664684 RepID=A0A7I8VM93_9ANNE|nr:DgyrCDS6177 [Dimorphilus gyrociliatus]